MGFGTELADSITGNVEHAVITIEDKRAANALQTISSGSSDASLSRYVQAVKEQSAIASALTNGVKKSFRVQFNPSSLSLSARGGGTQPKMTPATGSDGKEILAYTCMVIPPQIDMSVKLIFDQVNNSNSFINEKFILKQTSLAAQGINYAREKEFTVQPYVEGFMAAVRNPNTRELSFLWGDFEFYGKLGSVNAAYTMFSISGQPVRAEVSLSLSAKQDKIKHEDYKNLPVTGLTKMGKSVEKVGNLLNLPF